MILGYTGENMSVDEMERKDDRLFILDSGVFISGYAHLFHSYLALTTSFVVDEIKSARARLELEKLRYTTLNVIDPSADDIQAVKSISCEKNLKLSTADISVVALALMFFKRGKKVVVVSEDYTIQNICSFLNIPYMSVEKEGIKKKMEWIRICPACNRGVKAEEDVCEICGSKTRYILKNKE